MAREKVLLNGQPVGRLRASWILTKEAFRFFRADPEMIWIPLITSILNIFLFGILVTVFLFVILGTGIPVAEGEEAGVIDYVFLFCCYVIGAFTLSLSQAAIVHTVYTRAHGGNATLGESLKVAFSHWFSLLLWSVITSTVGLILRMIAERSKMLGWIVVLVIGVAWSVLTYFVVPAMVIDKNSAFASIGKSGQVFRSTWGETIVSNISIGLIFFIVHILAILSLVGLVIFSVASEMIGLLFVFFGVYVLFVITISLLHSALAGVLKTLLYVYASEGTVPENFNKELLEKMLGRKSDDISATPDIPAQVSTQSENKVL